MKTIRINFFSYKHYSTINFEMDTEDGRMSGASTEFKKLFNIFTKRFGKILSIDLLNTSVEIAFDDDKYEILKTILNYNRYKKTIFKKLKKYLEKDDMEGFKNAIHEIERKIIENNI